MCPVSLAHSVADVFSREGASMTQQGFVHHKRQPSRKQGEQTYNIWWYGNLEVVIFKSVNVALCSFKSGRLLYLFTYIASNSS